MTDMRLPLLQKIDAQSKKTPYFLLHFCVVSPPALRRRDSAFELFALLILSFFLFFFLYFYSILSTVQLFLAFLIHSLIPFRRFFSFSFPTPNIRRH